MAVGTFSGEDITALFLIKAGPPIHQFPYADGSLLDQDLDRFSAAETFPGSQRVLQVRLQAVFLLEYHRNAALGKPGCARKPPTFIDDQDRTVGGKLNGGPKPCNAAPDNKEIGPADVEG